MSSVNAHLEYAISICECGETAPLRTSWTEDNPGRHFYNCRNYGTPYGRCYYFDWVDPELPERAANVINKLLRKTQRLEAEKKDLEKKLMMRKARNCFV